MELKLEGKVEGVTSILKRRFIRVFRHSQSCASKAEGTNVVSFYLLDGCWKGIFS